MGGAGARALCGAGGGGDGSGEHQRVPRAVRLCDDGGRKSLRSVGALHSSEHRALRRGCAA
eukprot:950992-Pyramimonas_sp.AAC.1